MILNNLRVRLLENSLERENMEISVLLNQIFTSFLIFYFIFLFSIFLIFYPLFFIFLIFYFIFISILFLFIFNFSYYQKIKT